VDSHGSIVDEDVEAVGRPLNQDNEEKREEAKVVKDINLVVSHVHVLVPFHFQLQQLVRQLYL
jgi:hypothetical protein